MATDIGSLAAGMHGHVVRLSIGRKNLGKTYKLFHVHSQSVVDSIAFVPLTIPTRLPANFRSLSLLLFELPINFPFLHSLGQDTD
jgi:hypothetical protein